MYDVIKAVVWTCYYEFGDLFVTFWFISSIINLLTLKCYGVKWYALALIPFSHNAYKLYFTDDPPIPWVIGLVPAVIGILSLITWSPIGTILYLLLNVVVNYFFGRSMYYNPVVFALIPFYRYYVQIRYIIEERRS